MSSGLIGGGETIAMVERVTPPGMRVAEFPNAFQQNVPGYTIYGIFWIATLLGSSLSALIAVSLAAATTATGLGMLVSALARTEAQIGGLTTLLLTMSALGGCFVPRFTMPDWLKTLGLITPHAWTLKCVSGFVRARVRLSRDSAQGRYARRVCDCLLRDWRVAIPV
jgi:hypothetical protein